MSSPTLRTLCLVMCLAREDSPLKKCVCVCVCVCIYMYVDISLDQISKENIKRTKKKNKQTNQSNYD